MKIRARPVWPVLTLAAVQLVDAELCRRPAAFVTRCLDDVHCPPAVRRWLPRIKVAAALGLLGGLVVPQLGVLTCAALVAYFSIAVALHVRARRPRFPTDDRLHRATTTRFFRACQTGQVDELLALLAPEVVLVADGGGKVRAALQPVVGAAKVARLCVALATAGVPGLRMEIRQVNHLSGVVAWVDDQPFAVVQLQTSAEGVDRVDLVRNPDKLGALTVSASGLFGQLGR